MRSAGALFALAVAGAVTLTACSEDTETGGDGSAIGVECVDGTIQGAGSSAQKNAMDEWVKAYQTACASSTINYQPVGSGAGIQQFLEGTVTFAGSDSALKDDEVTAAAERCENNPAWNLPMVIGPVAVGFNVEGLSELNLSSATLAGIFGGTITKWNAPEIAADNPGATLPDLAIQSFHRSDDSGTTDNFTKYLEGAAGGAWTYGAGKTWKAPGGQGAKGSDGVTAAVNQTNGAIGYMEWSFAENSGLAIASLNGAALSEETVGKAVEASEVVGEGNDLVVQIDYGLQGDDVYPLILVTYEIVCSAGTPAGEVDLLKSFLSYTASDEGQETIAALKYAPLPSGLAEQVRTAVDEIA